MVARVVEIDLYRDWIAHLRSELLAFGYDLSALASDMQVTHTFFNALRRLVSSTPRRILESKGFSCPAVLSLGLADVRKKITNGDDLTPHLSRSLRRPTFNDAMLNDWGIHHLHLGSTIEADGFAGRTGDVLFARFDETTAYFLDVLPHGSWAMQKVVESIHENWPDSIKQFRLTGVLASEPPLSDADVATLRRKNVNAFVRVVDGTVYAPMGRGYMSSGISMDVVRRADYCAQRLGQMQQAVIEGIETIAADARSRGLELPQSVRFALEVEGNSIIAVEDTAKLRVRLGPL